MVRGSATVANASRMPFVFLDAIVDSVDLSEVAESVTIFDARFKNHVVAGKHLLSSFVVSV